jgi:hypothetical protein
MEMDDFLYLLVRAARATGTVLDVAMLLQVEPSQVYRWIAGMDLPSDERIGDFKAQLQRVLYCSAPAATP